MLFLVMGTSAQAIGWPDELVAALVSGGLQVIRFDHRDTGQSDCVDFARVRTRTAIMTSPMGYQAGPAWARALAGKPPEPGDLPAPSPEFLRHVTAMASSPPGTPEERLRASVETWRILNGTALPFDTAAARRNVEEAAARARNLQAAAQHDLAGRQMTPERQVPLSRITAPALVIHGTADPLLPPANGAALATLIPGARFHQVPGMGHGFFSPGLPARIARLILDHTIPELSKSAPAGDRHETSRKLWWHDGGTTVRLRGPNGSSLSG